MYSVSLETGSDVGWKNIYCMLDADLAMIVSKPSRLALLFKGQITNTDDERPLSLSAIPKTVKIMLFPKPVGRTARTSSPFCM